MVSLERIKDWVDKNLHVLSGKYNVKRVAITGSYARGSQNDKSDLDLVIEFSAPVSLLTIAGLENYLTELLGIETDIIPKEDIREELKESILKDARYL